MTNAFDIPMNDVLLVEVRYCIRSQYKLHKLSVVYDNTTKHLLHTIFTGTSFVTINLNCH